MHAKTVSVKSLLAINKLNYMDRFLKRSAPGDTGPSPAKKFKSDAKQGNIPAAFRVQEFKTYFVDRRRVI